jgi:hypothetical protein
MAEAMVPGRGAACGGFPWTTQQLGSSRDLEIFVLNIIIIDMILLNMKHHRFYYSR